MLRLLAIALIGAVSSRFGDLMNDLWPLVTYLWSAVVFLLFISLIIRGAVALIDALLKKGSPA